jgi:hypothetical protein
MGKVFGNVRTKLTILDFLSVLQYVYDIKKDKKCNGLARLIIMGNTLITLFENIEVSNNG